MAGWLESWIVEEMVSTLTVKPDACLILAPGLIPASGPIRVRRGGVRWSLHRYLLYRVTGKVPDPKVALLEGGCSSPGCQNPFHRIESRRRTMSAARKREYRERRSQHGRNG